MAWSSPMTAVANATFTAAQFNTYVRDNLSETAPAQASAEGRIIVTSGTNQIRPRAVLEDAISTSELTASATYTDLTSVGPSVTLSTGTHALVIITCRGLTESAAAQGLASHAVSGASTVAASDAWAIIHNGTTSSRFAAAHLFTTLTAGGNTFTMKYKTSIATSDATFQDRAITVIGL